MTLWSVGNPGHVPALVTLVMLLDITDTTAPVTSKTSLGVRQAARLKPERIPPSILFPTQPMEKVMLTNHQEERIQCRATGQPPPTYAWYRNGVLIKNNNNNVKSFSNGELVLIKFVTSSNGIFVCFAMNALGTAVSQEIRILALYFPSASVANQDPPKIYSLVLGQPFSIPCDKAVETVPKMDKKWYYVPMNQLTYNARIGMDLKGTLHAAYATKEDNGRVYECGLVPSRSNINRINLYEQGKVSVKLYKDPVSNRKKPGVHYFGKWTKANIGYPATLECFFESKPPAQIAWKTSSNQLVTPDDKRMSVTDFGRKLVIHKVQDEDEGVYTCTGTNSYGSTMERLILNVTTPPLLVKETTLKTQTVPDNIEATLHCKTRAAIGEKNHPPLWFRNARALDKAKLPDKTRYTFSRDMTRLKITSLSKTADTACFQCNVSNSEGFLFSDSYLRVINSIRVTKSPPYLVNIVPGDVIDVEVRAKGDDCCSLNMLWKYQKQPIRPEEWPVFDTDKKSGRILFNSSLGGGDVLTNYLGVYTVRVSNQYQSVDVVFEIRIRGKGESSWLFASYENWWPGLLVLLLLAICAIFGYAAHRIRKNRFKSFQSADTETQKPTDLPEEQLSGLASESQIADQTVESEESRSDIGESVVESSVDDESFV